MSEIVYYKGQGYEVGSIYTTLDKNLVCVLGCVRGGGVYVEYCSSGIKDVKEYLYPIPDLPVGKITKQLIPEDGCWYMGTYTSVDITRPVFYKEGNYYATEGTGFEEKISGDPVLLYKMGEVE